MSVATGHRLGADRTSARRPDARTSRRLLAHGLLILGGIVMLYPLLWLAVATVKPSTSVFGDPSLIPSSITWSNFTQGWTGVGAPFIHYIINSLIVCALAVAGNLISCSMAAYAFARLDFSLRKILFALMLMTIMLPVFVTLIVQYTIFRYMGWIDTFLPLIVPKFLATDAFFIFLMVQFIRGLPLELEDAARIDGCGPGGIYLRIVLPLLRPALVTTMIFTFIWTYNDFFSQLIYLSSPANLTVPVALASFLDNTGQSEWGQLFAMSLISLVPVLIVFIACQRQIVEGMAGSGLKG